MATSAQFKITDGPPSWKMILALHDRELAVRSISISIVFEPETGSWIKLPLSLDTFAYRSEKGLVLAGELLPLHVGESFEDAKIREAAIGWVLGGQDMPYYRASYQNQNGWLAFSDQSLIPDNIF